MGRPLGRVGTVPLRTAPAVQEIPKESCGSTKYALAGSPLVLTTYDKPFNFSEVQFTLSEKINFMLERFCETDAGPWLLNSFLFFTVARMAAYYFYMQPAYLRHFQERYGQSWKVGHHLYGSTLPNPLKK